MIYGVVRGKEALYLAFGVDGAEERTEEGLLEGHADEDTQVGWLILILKRSLKGI